MDTINLWHDTDPTQEQSTAPNVSRRNAIRSIIWGILATWSEVHAKSSTYTSIESHVDTGIHSITIHGNDLEMVHAIASNTFEWLINKTLRTNGAHFIVKPGSLTSKIEKKNGFYSITYTITLTPAGKWKPFISWVSMRGTAITGSNAIKTVEWIQKSRIPMWQAGMQKKDANVQFLQVQPTNNNDRLAHEAILWFRIDSGK
jgi:hypothetical protein